MLCAKPQHHCERAAERMIDGLSGGRLMPCPLDGGSNSPGLPCGLNVLYRPAKFSPFRRAWTRPYGTAVMKQDIHPGYHTIKVVMTDGSEFVTATGARKGDVMHLEHRPEVAPAWTGGQQHPPWMDRRRPRRPVSRFPEEVLRAS